MNYYIIDGVQYPRVTHILGVLNREGLNIWREKVGTSYREEVVQKAQDIGTETHKFIQRIINGGKIESGEWSMLAPEIQSALQAWVGFTKRLKPQFKHTELLLHSKKYGYAGTTDAVALIDGHLTICDWKTANNLWDEVDLQMAAYAMAFYEQYGEKPVSCRAIRLDKSQGYWSHKDQVILTNIDDAFEAFLGAIKIYNYRRNR